MTLTSLLFVAAGVVLCVGLGFFPWWLERHAARDPFAAILRAPADEIQLLLIERRCVLRSEFPPERVWPLLQALDRLDES